MTHFDIMFAAALRDWLLLPSDAPRVVREYFRDGLARLERAPRQEAWKKNQTDEPSQKGDVGE